MIPQTMDLSTYVCMYLETKLFGTFVVFIAAAVGQPANSHRV